MARLHEQLAERVLRGTHFGKHQTALTCLVLKCCAAFYLFALGPEVGGETSIYSFPQIARYLTEHFAFLISINSQELNVVIPTLKLRKYKLKAWGNPKIREWPRFISMGA